MELEMKVGGSTIGRQLSTCHRELVGKTPMEHQLQGNRGCGGRNWLDICKQQTK